MLVKLNIWRKYIFARLIITFLVFMIPVYFLGIAIYDWGTGTINAAISMTKSGQISFFIGNFEKEIQRIKSKHSEIILNDEIMALSTYPQDMDDLQISSYIAKLQDHLSTIMNCSVYIENAVAIIPVINNSISVYSNSNIMNKEDLKLLKLKDRTTDSQLTYFNNELYFNTAIPIDYEEKKINPSYSIYIKLSSDEIKKALSQFNYDNGSGTFIYNNEKAFILDSSQSNQTTKVIKDEVERYIKVSGNGKYSIKIRSENYLIIYTHSEYLGMTLCYYIPEKQIYYSLQKYRILYWIFTVVSGILIVIFSFSLYQFMHRPLKKLLAAFIRLESGEMNFNIKSKNQDEFGYLYKRFNDMLKNLNTLIDHAYKQKIMIQRAELKQLQAQINPHFLYNSFLILYSMTRRGQYETLEKFALQLGEYFQFITRNAADEVPLSKEVSHARTYCDIQVMRFSNRINVEFEELPLAYSDFKVPRLILQPIIENAFVHGLEKKEENGVLKISFEVFEEIFRILIEDNGEEISDDEMEAIKRKIESRGDEIEATGIINIHRRIRLKFGDHSGILVSRGSMGGFAVIIEISMKSLEETCHV